MMSVIKAQPIAFKSKFNESQIKPECITLIGSYSIPKLSTIIASFELKSDTYKVSAPIVICSDHFGGLSHPYITKKDKTLEILIENSVDEVRVVSLEIDVQY